jgi:hypothetical protein
MTRYARYIALSLLLGLAVVPAAQASTHFSVQIGGPGPVVVAPAPIAAPYGGSYWRPGHYEWTRFGYRWVPGHWVRSGYARRGWSRDRWERHDWYDDRYRYRDRRDYQDDRGYWNGDRDWNRTDRGYYDGDRRGYGR